MDVIRTCTAHVPRHSCLTSLFVSLLIRSLLSLFSGVDRLWLLVVVAVVVVGLIVCFVIYCFVLFVCCCLLIPFLVV